MTAPDFPSGLPASAGLVPPFYERRGHGRAGDGCCQAAVLGPGQAELCKASGEGGRTFVRQLKPSLDNYNQAQTAPGCGSWHWD